MSAPPAVPRPSSCDGCSGSRVCWVCLGKGCVPSPSRPSRCAGDGVCRLCLAVPAQRQSDRVAAPVRDRLAEQA